MGLPPSVGMGDALRGDVNIVSFSPFLDDTTIMADLPPARPGIAGGLGQRRAGAGAGLPDGGFPAAGDKPAQFPGPTQFPGHPAVHSLRFRRRRKAALEQVRGHAEGKRRGTVRPQPGFHIGGDGKGSSGRNCWPRADGGTKIPSAPPAWRRRMDCWRTSPPKRRRPGFQGTGISTWRPSPTIPWWRGATPTCPGCRRRPTL